MSVPLLRAVWRQTRSLQYKSRLSFEGKLLAGSSVLADEPDLAKNN